MENYHFLEYIQERVEKLKNSCGSDIESDHMTEDDIYREALEWIASGLCEGSYAEEIAICVLETKEFIKRRWYA